MRDLVFVAYLLALFGMGCRRPFLFVLAYIYVDFVSPQRLTYLLLNSVPISLIAGLAAIGGWALFDRKDGARVGPRQCALLLLIAWCFATTKMADFPVEAAEKWDWAWKGMAFGFFLPMMLRTRLRIEATVLFVVLSVSSIVIVGGIKTLFSGGGYGSLNLMVTNNSGLYEGSTISTVAIAIIPLVLWLGRFQTIFPRGRLVTLFTLSLTFACLLIPVGTSTRTGLLCIGLVAVLMLRGSRHKVRYLATIGAIALVAVPFLPSAFSSRMETIKTYQADASASTRIAVWQWTWNYVQDHPLGGGFDMFRQNRIRYDTMKVVTDGGVTRIVRTPIVDQGRAFHSAYFEMLGEQGWPGFLLWLSLNLGGLLRMEVLRRRHARDEDAAWVSPLAAALQTAQLVYLLGSTFIAIAYQPFLYTVFGIQMALDAYLSRRAVRPAPLARPRAPRLAAT